MVYDDSILRHCREIDRCNQRGGRMLSVVDLIEAETLSAELAAYCLAAVGQGASFMVGALPGGAGKTSRKTPDEIASAAERYGIAGSDRLVYASGMSAKVDSAAVQDAQIRRR